jgi:hypothetical protein
VFGILGYIATLPLRLALRGAETLIRLVAGGGDEAGVPQATAPATPSPAAPARPRSRPEPARTRRAAAPRAPEVPAEEPEHVSEEPVLVEEFADAGAEDGAGPEITVAEPWPAYGSMKANEVIARLGQAGPAEVAVARLYEQANRGRKTVLAAADRRLKALGA